MKVTHFFCVDIKIDRKLQKQVINICPELNRKITHSPEALCGNFRFHCYQVYLEINEVIICQKFKE